MTVPNDRAAAPNRWMRFLAARVDSKSYLGLHFTVGLVVISLGLWLFGGLLEEILENAALVHWDMAAAAWIHSTITPLGVRVFVAFTNLGSPPVMTALALVGTITMFVKGHRLLAYAWIAAVAGGAILDQVLKITVHRNRPEYAAAFLHGHTYSFPSGHAMGSMIGFGFLACAIVIVAKLRGRRRTMAYGLALLATLLVGISRVYIGVHYPSDVIGGWAAGLAWLAVCITGFQVVTGRSMAHLPKADS